MLMPIPAQRLDQNTDTSNLLAFQLRGLPFGVQYGPAAR